MLYIPRITPVSHAQMEIVQIVAILVVWYWYDGMCHPVKNAGSRHRVFSEFTAIYGMLMDAMLGYQDSDPSSNVWQSAQAVLLDPQWPRPRFTKTIPYFGGRDRNNFFGKR